jgi:hypothetical protein
MSTVYCTNCQSLAICELPGVFVPNTSNVIGWCGECYTCTFQGCNNIIEKRVNWDIVDESLTNTYYKDVCTLHSQPQYTPDNVDATNIVIDDYVYF